jgi:type II secretory pathway predicted ATPase ExeA
MYEAFFKFQARPFGSTPDPRCYYPATLIEGARQTLARLVERGEGPGLVIGPPGTGKTLLCLLLAEQFRDQFAVALLSGGRLRSCRVLLQTILYELKRPCRGMDEGDLRLTLMDLLEPKGDSRGLLLLVDEAHALPLRLLEELRLMTNLVRDGQPRVRLVLAGSPALEERFASPKLASFAQRIAARCYLEPLDGTETGSYVRGQIAAAGGEAERLIDDEALRSIYRATDGIPRLINQVCDHALVLANLGGHQRLNARAIEEAWADLQQLPVPWRAAAGQQRGSDIVEFGRLADDEDELPEAIPFRATDKQAQAALHVAQPDEQLDAIAQQLSAIEEDDRPARVGTEIELDFPEFGDPFNEQFAEEEVVLNPYRSEYEIFAELPRVSCWEGQQLASMLQPLAESSAQPRPTIVMPPAEGESQGLAASRSTRESIDRMTGGQDERDVIVVEEKPPAAGSTRPTPPMSKKELRLMFSKLRRQ